MEQNKQCMLVLMAAPVNPWIGGDPLVTANGTSGTVSGGLWFDAYPGFASVYTTPIMKGFTSIRTDFVHFGFFCRLPFITPSDTYR